MPRLSQSTKFSLSSGFPGSYPPGMIEASSRIVNAATRYCAVYGHPIRHSASPAMHNPALAELGLNWCYLAFEVIPVNLRRAIDGARAMGFIGLNLTVPHKLLALEMVDELDESARDWGAVNTIRFEVKDDNGNSVPLGRLDEVPGGQIITRGFNTDAEGIAIALREDLGLELQGLRALVLGAGGAGRVAALKLAAEGAGELFLSNRTRSRAEALAEEIGSRHSETRISLDPPNPERVELILNATSLGLKLEDPSPLDPAFQIRPSHAVYDMIYKPPETLLLKNAREVGCRVANGMGMLLYQGARALEIWSGKTAPVATMREALRQYIYGRGH